MFKIKVSATTANLGPGFDCLGLALNLYNEFYFEKRDKYEFGNINEKYKNENNLVIRSSKETYKYLKIKEVPYFLESKDNIPLARGLGSSASCIIAGVKAALILADKKLCDDEILTIASRIEGHPDNTSSAYLGSLVASVDGEVVKACKYDVNSELLFTIVIPPFPLRTEDARKVLPASLSYHDVIYSMSRAINIPKALKDGNVELLYELLKDRLHQPYRFSLIKDSLLYIDFSQKQKIPFCISGSGSTMLFITKHSIKNDVEKINKDYKVLELHCEKEGVIYEK